MLLKQKVPRRPSIKMGIDLSLLEVSTFKIPSVQKSKPKMLLGSNVSKLNSYRLFITLS